MTTKDILDEVPRDKGYEPTTRLSFFAATESPIHDEQKILAQKWQSGFVGIPDVWVAIPTVNLDYGG